MLQGGAGLHDGGDFVGGGVRFGVGGIAFDLWTHICIDQGFGVAGLDHHYIAIEGGQVKECAIN